MQQLDNSMISNRFKLNAEKAVYMDWKNPSAAEKHRRSPQK